MRYSFSIILACSLLLLAAGCKDKNTPDNNKFTGNSERPSWTAPVEYDYTSSMTAVIKVDLAAQYPDQASDFVLNDEDILAAFAGENCLGIASPQEGLFFLFVVGAEGSVTLRYYSKHYKNIFVANNAFEFRNDANIGTIANPLKPIFMLEK